MSDFQDESHESLFNEDELRAPHPERDYARTYTMEDYAEEDDGLDDCSMSDSEYASHDMSLSQPSHPRQIRQRRLVSFNNVAEVRGNSPPNSRASNSAGCQDILDPGKGPAHPEDDIDVESGTGSGTGAPVQETAVTHLDGISFSTVSCDDWTRTPTAAVDAVPSAFEAPPTSNKAGAPKLGIRSRSMRKKSETTEETEAPTASITGASPAISRLSLGSSPTGPTKGGGALLSASSSSSSPRRIPTKKAILHAKIAFFAFLVAVALVACGLLFAWLRESEARFARDQFESIAARAVADSADVVSRKRLSMATMSSMISEVFRETSDWPNVAVTGYERIVEMLAKTGSHTNMGFAPVVKVSEQQGFEDFAYNYFASRPDYYPNTTGINSPDWRGIWRIQIQDGKKVRVHDADEITQERGILTPIIQCCIDNPGDRVLLYNLYSEPNRRKTINGINQCAQKIRASIFSQEDKSTMSLDSTHDESERLFATAAAKEGKSQQTTNLDYSCGSMTDFVNIVRFQTRGPASVMFQPIFPANAPWELRGLMLSPMAWDEIFEATFSSNVDGVHAVLESETKTHTYTISNGRVQTFQEGDIHQAKYDEFGVHANLTWNDLHEMGAPMYKLSLYPTDDFVKSYATGNPRNATMTALSIILFISFLFLLYDYFVRREFLERHQLLQAKRRFIRFVSHEVRTPLNAVLMGLSMIESEMELNDREELQGYNQEERMAILREIQNSAESAVEVLNDVLLYDKVETSLKLELSLVPIWQVVEKTLSEFKLPALRRGVHLRSIYKTSTTEGDCGYDAGVRVADVKNLPEDVRCLCVAGDPSRIAQILRNLFSNALKFTSENGSIIITASYQNKSMVEERKIRWKGSPTWHEKIILKNGEEVMATPQGHIQLTVQDTGVGMTQDELSKLFGEGVQFNAHELQEGKGSGLGLFIAKGLVLQHKGTLEATSEGVDKGSTFSLKLPLYHVPGFSVEQEESDHSLDKISSINEEISWFEEHGLHLLVVDDAPSNRSLLCQLLENKGHTCEIAENGQVAVEMVRETMYGGKPPYDSILMDYEMPIMNGPTAASLIRELGSDAFIIGVTGNVLTDDIHYYKTKGANAVLTKPINLSSLDELFMEHHLSY